MAGHVSDVLAAVRIIQARARVLGLVQTGKPKRTRCKQPQTAIRGLVDLELLELRLPPAGPRGTLMAARSGWAGLWCMRRTGVQQGGQHGSAGAGPVPVLVLIAVVVR